jgi:cyclopropane-fatty-acyl-phospholipid synthase
MDASSHASVRKRDLKGMPTSVESRRAEILSDLFQGYDSPSFSVRLWNGWQWFTGREGKSSFTLVVNTPPALLALMIEPSELTLGEAFIQGALDIEGDIFAAFSLSEYVLNRPRGLRQQIFENITGRLFAVEQWIKRGPQHSLRRDRSSVSYHYDRPVQFYEPWLGSSLVYSCAYFRSSGDSLELAQKQKLDLICHKLRLKPLECMLDIGCGWGSLFLDAAMKYQVLAQGITLCREQARVANARIEEAKLNQSCAVEVRDYRDQAKLGASFDKIASVGMFEHVGRTNLPRYFRVVHGLLKPGGVFLNHGIASSQGSLPRRASFIDKYVFPDGQLVTLPQALKAAESAGFEVRDVEDLREHYDLTLRHWVHGLQRNADTLLGFVSQAAYRTWLLYMAGSAAAFRRGDIGVYQVLLSRHDRGCSCLPLTREDWYSHRPPNQRAEFTGSDARVNQLRNAV